jgi:adenine-specific DNA methylase
LFAGSGTVAAALAADRDVTSVDVQNYARVICAALMSGAAPSSALLTEKFRQLARESKLGGGLRAAASLIELEERLINNAKRGDILPLCDLVDVGPLAGLRQSRNAVSSPTINSAVQDCLQTLSDLRIDQGPSTTALRYFGGVYFSFRQAAEIDLLLDLQDHVPPKERDTVLAAVLSAASQIVNTVGKQFAQPLRLRTKAGLPKPNLLQMIYRDRSLPVFQSFIASIDRYQQHAITGGQHRAVCSDYRRFLDKDKQDFGAYYADPPYTRDHYSRFYHVLETLCLRDDPPISSNKVHGRVVLSRGAYRADRHQSPFCIRSEAPGAFNELFEKVAERRKPLVVSYSPFSKEDDAHPRVMLLDDVMWIAKNHFKSVEVRSVGSFSHSKLNRAGLRKQASGEAEHLILCRP